MNRDKATFGEDPNELIMALWLSADGERAMEMERAVFPVGYVGSSRFCRGCLVGLVQLCKFVFGVSWFP